MTTQNKKQFTRHCPTCNSTILYKRKKDKNYDEKQKKICRSCSYKKRNESGNYNPKEKFICACCGINFFAWRSQMANPNIPICSKECRKLFGKRPLVGMRFGKLLVIKRIRTNNTTYYECECDCGKKSMTTHSNLLSGTKSCGCLIKETRGGERKPLNVVVPNAILTCYKRNAKNRNYTWSLTYDEFIKLINGNCYYCGSEKSNVYIWKYKNETAEPISFNGIDRVDNTIGYTSNNCVSCCKICNSAKGALTTEEFKQWLEKLYMNFSKK